MLPAALATAWAVKLYLEVSAGTGLSSLPPGIHIAWQAHVAGIVAGLSVFAAIKQPSWKDDELRLMANR